MNRILAYAQLLRLPNAFTAVADIALAALVLWTMGGRSLNWSEALTVSLLMLSSTTLYSAGMAWNDFFDFVQDAKERPFRPLPSGRVSRQAAMWLAETFMLAGILLAAASDSINVDRSQGVPASLIALALSTVILLYDRVLKRTWLGPIGMGSCRFLNVRLGFCALPGDQHGVAYALASIVGIYTVGLTWFARREASKSHAWQLQLAAFLSALALLTTGFLPLETAPLSRSPQFWSLLIALIAWLGAPVVQALQNPGPAQVQRAVKRGVLGIILVDAVLAFGLVGVDGLAIALLYLPAAALGRVIYST
jgi:4-hydroxybenzoate polyprenyltransferase